jgi:hypothetical protein
MKNSIIAIKYVIYIYKLHIHTTIMIKSRHNAIFHHVDHINKYTSRRTFILIIYQAWTKCSLKDLTNHIPIPMT